MTKRSTDFEVVIVGGSVAGLTLAHCFERADIKYTLLEARNTISPQLGASIVIAPNGARILDQLGIYESMQRDFLTPMNSSTVWKADGDKVYNTNWPQIVEASLGYHYGIAERYVFLQSLYSQLIDPSKILLNKKVQRIEHSHHFVTIHCTDGSKYTSDIVVGADGIHSKTREEMQRSARETGPPGLMAKDENNITAEYNAIFGISSTPLPGLHPGEQHQSSDIDHSSLIFVTGDGTPQWIFCSKIPQASSRKEIPRYTAEQMNVVLEEFKEFGITGQLKIKDIIKGTKSLSFFPLEEASFKHWTYGRFVCLGDSIHKMTPNYGQGGNQAIESCAVLTNILIETKNRHPGVPASLPEIEQDLQLFQNSRKERADRVTRLSGLITRNEALDTLKATLRLLFMDPPTGERIAAYLKRRIPDTKLPRSSIPGLPTATLAY